MVIDIGEVIEDYPEDVRGHSCLVRGYGEDNRPAHVVCSPKEDYLGLHYSTISRLLKKNKFWFFRKKVEGW